MGILPERDVLSEFFIQTKPPEPYFDNNNEILTNANTTVGKNFEEFDVVPPSLNGTHFISPNEYQAGISPTNFTYNSNDLEMFWFHPDHLGSSNYITNIVGAVSQHMEYLPFGETLVEEHLNSNNSPFKFNAKELDEETGNYYYGARYYDPKWSIWLSVDPLAELMPEWSSYAYTFNNPVNFTDPTGMVPQGGGGCEGADCDDPPADFHIELDDVIVNAPSWTTEPNLAGTDPDSRSNNFKGSLDAYGSFVGQDFTSHEQAELWYSRTIEKMNKEAYMKDFNAGRAAMLNNIVPFLAAPALVVVGLEYGAFTLISQSAQAMFRLGANNQLVRTFVVQSGMDAALQYRVTGGDIDVISALAAGTGGKRYSIIFQAFAANVDYSIKNGYSDVFGFGKNPPKNLSNAGVDFGVGMYSGLGRHMTSSGNLLGKTAADALSTGAGLFIGQQIKDR